MKTALESRLAIPSLDSPALIAELRVGKSERLLVLLAPSARGQAVHLCRVRVRDDGTVKRLPNVAFKATIIPHMRRAFDEIERILSAAIPLAAEVTQDQESNHGDQRQ